LIREPRHSETYPPTERLLRAWIEAARARSGPDAQLLSQVAADLEQAQVVRYLALEELGRTSSAVGRAALEQVLVESGSDGYLRRKAAQALQDTLEPAEACEIFKRVADRETDPAMLLFLADMLDRSGCL
jgi:hypothetical protein